MKETILLIEDEIELQQNLKEILEYNGFSLLTADNGLEGLKKVENHAVDLIICDIMMPVMDGFQCIRELKSQDRFASIPFIFLSAKAGKQDRDKGLAEGAVDYLTKPISARMLLNAVFEALANRKIAEQTTSKHAETKGPTSDHFSASGSKKSIRSLVHHLELQKAAIDQQNWKEVEHQHQLATKAALKIQRSLAKLKSYKNLENDGCLPAVVSASDVILDKINELGPEKFVFRTRSAPSVKFDLNHLHFVLDELLANALSFVMPNSPIEVEFFGQDLSIKNKQSRHKSGDQVPVEPFSGVSEDSSEEGKLGLGLYLIQAYCEKNGAKMNHRVNESDEFILTISFKLA